jgi:hypothetical protein
MTIHAGFERKNVMCYSLDLEYFPKAHVVNPYSPALDSIGRWQNLEEVRPTGRKLGHLGHVL